MPNVFHIVKNYIRAWAYLLNGPSIVQLGFDQVRPSYSHFNCVEQNSQIFTVTRKTL